MTAVLRERASSTPVASNQAPAPVRAHPNVVLAVILAGAAATIGLWWHDTPLIHGAGD
jgi:hypothetical protein